MEVQVRFLIPDTPHKISFWLEMYKLIFPNCEI